MEEAIGRYKVYTNLRPKPFLIEKEVEEPKKNDDELFNEFIVASWKEANEMEKKRYSFFDELFYRGYVVDSMEVPKETFDDEEKGPSHVARYPQKVEYFVEAEESDYRDKIDYGRIVFKTKQVYTGNFVDWFFQGPGRYVWMDGTVFQGNFDQGIMNGQGSIHWPDGCVYEGDFLLGKRTGWGVYSTSEGLTYAGDWLEGIPHGKGKMWYDPGDDEGDFYDGDWLEGFQTGMGIRQYSNGDRYIGEMIKGGRSGQGTMIWLKERQIYKGTWVEGVPHGAKGKHIWFLERRAEEGAAFPTRHVYFGDWEEGRRHGVGKMIYPCGSIYEGTWKDGQRHGKGMFVNPAGDVLVGLFKAGAILGGSNVPLHAPTYEYDFGGLIESLMNKFNINIKDEFVETEHLSEITIMFLTQLRKLYARAGKFSQSWGEYGLFPYWMKPSYGQGSNLEPSHMQDKWEKANPDSVNPVTRFGLWLLIKDCFGLTNDKTMAYFDKLFCETPTISFQTRYNPFEPVYLWQFLQCMVVVAVGIYLDIPEQKIRFEIEKNQIKDVVVEKEVKKQDEEVEFTEEEDQEEEWLEDQEEYHFPDEDEDEDVDIITPSQMEISLAKTSHLKHHHKGHGKKGVKSAHHVGNPSPSNHHKVKSGKGLMKSHLEHGNQGDSHSPPPSASPSPIAVLSPVPIDPMEPTLHSEEHQETSEIEDKNKISIKRTSNGRGKGSTSKEHEHRHSDPTHIHTDLKSNDHTHSNTHTNEHEHQGHRNSNPPKQSNATNRGLTTESKSSINSPDSFVSSENSGSVATLFQPLHKENTESIMYLDKSSKPIRTWDEVTLPHESLFRGWDLRKECKEIVRKRSIDTFKVLNFKQEFEQQIYHAGEGSKPPSLPEVTEVKEEIKYGMSISHAFELFLMEKIVPCLDSEAGKNLPLIPTPLPALVDLYEAFKSISNKENDCVISGEEFVQSVIVAIENFEGETESEALSLAIPDSNENLDESLSVAYGLDEGDDLELELELEEKRFTPTFPRDKVLNKFSSRENDYFSVDEEIYSEAGLGKTFIPGMSFAKGKSLTRLKSFKKFGTSFGLSKSFASMRSFAKGKSFIGKSPRKSVVNPNLKSFSKIGKTLINAKSFTKYTQGKSYGPRKSFRALKAFVAQEEEKSKESFTVGKEQSISLGEWKDKEDESLSLELESDSFLGSLTQVDDDPNNLIKNAKVSIIAQQNKEGGDDYLMDGLALSENELLSEPFLWEDNPTMVKVPKNPMKYRNLKLEDVLKVLRFLYPKLIEQIEENNMKLEFDMIFVDWLWAISMTAKISADKEVYEALFHPNLKSRPFNFTPENVDSGADEGKWGEEEETDGISQIESHSNYDQEEEEEGYGIA